MYGNWVSSIPSRFVEELPGEYVARSSAMGLSQGGRSQHWDSSGFAPSRPVAPSIPTAGGGQKVKAATGEVFARGDRVFHDKFGYGAIVSIDGHKLDIKFETSGLKRVLDRFVTAG